MSGCSQHPPQDVWISPGGRSCPSSKEQNASALHGSAADRALQYAAAAGAWGTRSLTVLSPGCHRCLGVRSSLTKLPARRTATSKHQHSSSCVLFMCWTNWANPKPGFRQVWDAQGGDKRHWGKSLHHDLGSGSTRNASCHPLLLCLLHSAPNHPSPCHQGAGPAAGTVQLCIYTDTSCLVVTLSCTSLYVRVCIKQHFYAISLFSNLNCFKINGL